MCPPCRALRAWARGDATAHWWAAPLCLRLDYSDRNRGGWPFPRRVDARRRSRPREVERRRLDLHALLRPWGLARPGPPGFQASEPFPHRFPRWDGGGHPEGGGRHGPSAFRRGRVNRPRRPRSSPGGLPGRRRCREWADQAGSAGRMGVRSRHASRGRPAGRGRHRSLVLHPGDNDGRGGDRPGAPGRPGRRGFRPGTRDRHAGDGCRPRAWDGNWLRCQRRGDEQRPPGVHRGCCLCRARGTETDRPGRGTIIGDTSRSAVSIAGAGVGRGSWCLGRRPGCGEPAWSGGRISRSVPRS